MKPYYPTMNLGALAALRTLRQQLGLHPGYLDQPDCPYDDDTREQLKELLAPKIVEVPVEKIVEKIVEKRVEVAAKAAEGAGKRGPKAKTAGMDIDEVTKEIEDLRAELRQLKLDAKALQTADKISIINLRAKVIEKLISLGERAYNIKRMSIFQSTVMGILDDLVSEEGRQDFMKRLEPFTLSE